MLTQTSPLQANRVWRAGNTSSALASKIAQEDAWAGLISRLGAFLALLAMPAWLWALFYSSDNPISHDYFLVLVIACAGGLFIFFCTQTDPVLREIMAAGLLLKYAAASAYIYVVFRVYGAAADLPVYHTSGYLLASDFTSLGRWPILDPFIGTNFVKFSVAMIYVVLGPSLPGAVAVYLTMAYFGQYLFYRAFCIAYPLGDRRKAALFMFLLPSILYWPSSLGKDCQALLAIGMVTYGLAFASRKNGFRGYLYIGLGLGLVFLVRPHVAGILAITCALPYVLGKSRTGLWGGILKLAIAPAMLAAAFFLAQQGAEFVELRGTSSGATEAALNKIAANNATGRSSFNVGTSVPVRIMMSPFLMFRPFPWEARNLQSFVAAAEGFFLLVFAWRQRHQLVLAVRRSRSDAFAAYALSYAVVFSILFAGAMTNFGLLARQRVMMLPVALLLFLATDLRLAATVPAQQRMKTVTGWLRDLGGRRRGPRWAIR